MQAVLKVHAGVPEEQLKETLSVMTLIRKIVRE